MWASPSGQPAGVPPADRDPGALLDQAIRERRSQPVGPAGDKHDLAIQMQIHGTILAQPEPAGGPQALADAKDF